MKYGMEDQPPSNISKYLEVIVTLKGTRMILEILTLGLMKEYFYDINPPRRHIDVTIKGYKILYKVQM